MKISDVLPRKYSLHARDGLDAQPFFVLGSGRNGSTLLNRILNQHTELFLPSEQYFLGHSIIKYKLYNFLVWRDLVKVIAGELAPSAQSHTWDYNAEDVLQNLFHMHPKGLDRMMDEIYRGYGKRLGEEFEFWGDTTPPNIHYARDIFFLFPRAKYIFMVRDGRDVVASHKKAGKSYVGEMADVRNASQLWSQSVETYFWLAKRTDVLLVKYEDLVTNPEDTLRDICRRLEIDFEMKMLSDDRKVPHIKSYQEPIHDNLGKPVFDHSIGNYKTALTAEELQLCIDVFGRNLKRMNYS